MRGFRGLGALIAGLLLAPAWQVQAAPSWSASVTRVTDGDTLWVRPVAGGKPLKIRIDGIDAPEICQAHGRVARAALAQRLRGRPLELETRRKDDYGRTVAVLYLDGEDIAGWMVSQGHAWSYSFGREGGRYAAQQQRAQAGQRGLFADRTAVEPRLFRKRHGSCHS